MTARDLQKKDGQWTRGKGFDTFCPVGPWWVPAEELEFSRLRVITRVNGETRQDAPVTDMLFDPGAILQFVTQFMTLEPGDLIATGTPPGVGLVQSGDRIEVEIPGLGTLENTIESA
jgi:2-keto-4-pentenoate hydratase/2-oxohepta-3-ene-1,7-dioic acid hydratase in catechol pathway